MKVVIDIEANSLVKPTNIWLIVCLDIETQQYHIFRRLTEDAEEKQRFFEFSQGVETWIGHNILGYDYPVLNSLLGFTLHDPAASCIDTLIISKLVDYSRQGHSIEAYGEEFGLRKGKFNDFTKYSKELEEYCTRDVDICLRVFKLYSRVLNDPVWQPSIRLENSFQLVVNDLHNNGFSFNLKRADTLLQKVNKELEELDLEILKAFPPKLKLVKEITPKETKHGTLSKSDFRWVTDGDLSEFNGGPFCRCSWVPFNPSSHKQIIQVLSQAGWSPTDKTQTHIDTEREINRLKYSRSENKELDLSSLNVKLNTLKDTGWKINETNLGTLPPSAPSPARTLAKRILLESRRRTLTEWLGLVQPDNRIHGKFYGIGAWTHRMAHQQPNTANIPTDAKLYGLEMRSLWQAPRNRLLVGADAEGIQLRIFAHYIDDPEFTDALVKGKKDDKTDPHSLNQRILGSVCKSRQDAKRFIYAYLLGAGLGKLAQVLGCETSEAQEGLDRLLIRYTGLARLKETTIPADAKRGWFSGLDGRKVSIPGDTQGSRKHLVMSGYLQNGEAIVVKRTVLKTLDNLRSVEAFKKSGLLVDVVHDEVIFEVKNDYTLAEKVRDTFCETIAEVGIELGLKCPLAGDGHIGLTWAEIH